MQKEISAPDCKPGLSTNRQETLDKSVSRVLPVGVLLRKEEEGVMGGVTGGVRFPVLWRGGVGTLLRHRPPVRGSDSLGCTFFLTASCSRRAASVTNLDLWHDELVEFLFSFFFFLLYLQRCGGLEKPSPPKTTGEFQS